MSRKFKVNDYVLLNGEVARVKEVESKHLIIQRKNKSPKLVSLKKIEQGGMINLSKKGTPIKGHVAFKTSKKIDLQKNENILLPLMEKHPQIIIAPKPYVSIIGLRNENIVFHLYFYSYQFDEIDDIENDLKNEILDAFAKKNISHLFRKSDFLEKKYISNN